jgi:hypothetical protein
MGDKTQLADELESCRDVSRAKPGVTEGVVKAEIRNGEYDSITPEILETISQYPATVSPVGGEGINYYIIIE